MSFQKSLFAALLTSAACVMGLVGPGMAEPFFASPSDAEMARLDKGEIITTSRTLPNSSVNEFTAMGIVNANWEDILEYYADVQNTRKFQNAIKKIDVVQENRAEMWRRAHYDLSLPWPIGQREFNLYLFANRDRRFIEWKLERGNVKEQRGSYATRELGAKKTLVSYRVAADLDTWLPAWLINFIQSGTVPHVIEQARKDVH
ncbi:MAG: SRPBCC family protein [bacterium]|nr:SRPBCC family protein [bacterium]